MYRQPLMVMYSCARKPRSCPSRSATIFRARLSQLLISNQEGRATIVFLSSFLAPILDQEDLITHRRVAIKQGGTLTVSGAYLRDLALLLEGCTSENEYNIPWSDPSYDVAKLSKTLTYYLRHSPLVTYDSEGFCYHEVRRIISGLRRNC